jgi:hypothetical protein
MKKVISLVFMLFFIFVCSTAVAQEEQPQPASEPSEKASETDTEESKPVIESIEGDCEYRDSEEADWAAAKKGQAVEPGGTLCTGFDSKVIVRFPEKSTLELGSLTQVSISAFFKAKKELEARLKVTVGSVRVRVQRGEIQSDFQVSTPHTTTAVKGTDWEVITSYYGDRIKVHEDTVKVKNKQDRKADIKEENETDDQLRSTAEIEREESIPPTVPIGLTQEETEASNADPASMDKGPGEQTNSTNPDQERQVVYPHSG